MRLSSLVRLSLSAGLLTATCACASASSSSKPASSQTQKSKPASTNAKDPAPAPAQKPQAAGAALESGATRVAGAALAGQWKGKDARDIIGTLNFCADGRATAVINGKTLGGQGGSTMTWKAKELAKDEAEVTLTVSAKENLAPFVMLMKRTSETTVVAAAAGGAVKRVDSAPANEQVNLERASKTASCD